MEEGHNPLCVALWVGHCGWSQSVRRTLSGGFILHTSHTLPPPPHFQYYECPKSNNWKTLLATLVKFQKEGEWDPWAEDAANSWELMFNPDAKRGGDSEEEEEEESEDSDGVYESDSEDDSEDSDEWNGDEDDDDEVYEEDDDDDGSSSLSSAEAKKRAKKDKKRSRDKDDEGAAKKRSRK